MFFVHELLVQADVEGRSMRALGLFTEASDAMKIGMTGYKNASMGGPGSGAEVKKVEVYQSLQEFVDKHADMDDRHVTALLKDAANEALKRRALAKLTPAERAALGFP